MSFFDSNRSFARAQAQYDAQMPPDDDGAECEKCEGTGKVFDDGAADAVAINCPDCDGEGVVYPPSQQEIADERAERRADERRDEGWNF
ncbi:MAG: hypothetical protein WCS42_22710 [Verrucomicrobiota bacterium]